MANWEKKVNLEENEEEEEFDESDIWDVMSTTPTDVSPTKPKNIPIPIPIGSTSSLNRFNTPRSVPSSIMITGPSNPAQNSAPVGIPDWSKITKKKPTCHADVDAEDDGEEEWVPPHVLLKDRYNKKNIARSMCEGIGCTLKGRQLRTLRNAILTKTGFIES